MIEADFAPTLTGETVVITPTVPDDWDGLFGVASDPELWAIHPDHERWKKEVFRLYFAAALAGHGMTVRDRATGQIIGATRYAYSADYPDACEVGWSFLARSHWGGSTNREVKRLMIAHALRYFEKVRFRVGTENWRSRRAMEKIGGKLLDGLVPLEMSDGRTIPHIVYEIGRDAALLAE